ncbi:MAG: hypothetical protein WC827_00545 [Candidatus Paceibacterota bacterium]|jgi:hypothetical protein
MNIKKIKEYFGSMKTEKVPIIIGIVLLIIVSFQAGMFVGFKKASFSFRTGENYFREMNGQRNNPMMGIVRDDFPAIHGAVGKIIKISSDSIVVLDKDQKEKIITVSTSTLIKRFNEDIKLSDLKVDDFIAVIGSPDNNISVGAKLIRVMPDPKNIPLLPEIR